jgi:hypothetical protein
MSFPAFWIFHASGFWSVLYRPIQLLTGTRTTGWPSLITACLVYAAVAAVFECMYRVLKNAQP